MPGKRYAVRTHAFVKQSSVRPLACLRWTRSKPPHANGTRRMSRHGRHRNNPPHPAELRSVLPLRRRHGSYRSNPSRDLRGAITPWKPEHYPTVTERASARRVERDQPRRRRVAHPGDEDERPGHVHRSPCDPSRVHPARTAAANWARLLGVSCRKNERRTDKREHHQRCTASFGV